MKNIATTLTLAFTAILAASQSASAEDGLRPQARFEYAPNVWAAEKPNMPKVWNTTAPTTTVRVGHVPTGGLMGGLDPTFLKPAPPPPAPVVHTAVNPSMFGNPGTVAAVPKAAPPAFSQQFGTPMKAPAQGVLPQQNAATPTAPAQTAAKPRTPDHIAYGHNNHVSGVLKKPQLPVGQHATPQIASYNTGYTSGAYTPTTGGSGTSSSTNLSGTILSHHK